MPVSADFPDDKPAPPITQLLRSVTAGDSAALGQLYASLYPELKRVAQAALYRQGRGESMQTTVLVHESFLRLLSSKDLRLQDRRHFFAYVARTMRSLIVDNAREQLALWRGGDVDHVTYSAEHVAHISLASDRMMRLDRALTDLSELDAELAELVEMRYFGGYTEREVAELWDVNERTVRRRWDKARAWLFVALGDHWHGDV